MGCGHYPLHYPQAGDVRNIGRRICAISYEIYAFSYETNAFALIRMLQRCGIFDRPTSNSRRLLRQAFSKGQAG
jgi:hypothetical protein